MGGEGALQQSGCQQTLAQGVLWQSEYQQTLGQGVLSKILADTGREGFLWQSKYHQTHGQGVLDANRHMDREYWMPTNTWTGSTGCQQTLWWCQYCVLCVCWWSSPELQVISVRLKCGFVWTGNVCAVWYTCVKRKCECSVCEQEMWMLCVICLNRKWECDLCVQEMLMQCVTCPLMSRCRATHPQWWRTHPIPSGMNTSCCEYFFSFVSNPHWVSVLLRSPLWRTQGCQRFSLYSLG